MGVETMKSLLSLFGAQKQIAPLPVPTQQPLTEADLKNIEEWNAKAQNLSDELEAWPHQRDFVKIKINGRIGQVIHIFLEDCEYNPSYQRSWDYCPEDKLKTARTNLEMAEYSYSQATQRHRYEVRLKNGSVVGNLRHWEIEKI